MIAGFVAGVAVMCVAAAQWVQADPAATPRAPGPARWLARRREREVARELPTLLEGVARGIRSGLSITVALTDAAPARGPLAGDVREVVGGVERGAGLGAALEAWAVRRAAVPGVRLTASALALAAESGGAIAQIVDGVADTLRGEAALAAEVRSLAAQAEASAVLIAVLPLGFGAIAGATDPGTLTFLTTPPLGPSCLALGVALDAVGFVWLRRITRSIR